MKKLFLLILLLFISFISYAQEEKFPRYFIQSGDTIGVIYSINQAQRIYNNEILIDLFKDLRHGCDSLAKKYVVVVNKYEQKQAIDKVLIEQYEKGRQENLLEIKRHQDKIDNLNQDLIKCNQQLGLKSGQYNNDQEIITILKRQRNWLLGGTIGFGTVAIFLTGMVLGN